MERRVGKNDRRVPHVIRSIPNPLYRDDASGQLTVRPGLEYDRRLFAGTGSFEGDDLPPHPDDPTEIVDPKVVAKRLMAEKFVARFQLDMLP
jgi:hypothetical protein